MDIYRRKKLEGRLARLEAANERLERELRTEVQTSARGTRADLTQGLSLFQQALLAQSSDVARTQNEQIDSFRMQLGAMQQHVSETLQRFSDGLNEQLRQVAEGNERKLGVPQFPRPKRVQYRL